jgi:hypothetical protein
LGETDWRTTAILTVGTVWSAAGPLLAFRAPKWPGWTLSAGFVFAAVCLSPMPTLTEFVLWWLAVMLALFAGAIVYLDWEDSNWPAVAWVGTLLALVMLWTNDGRSPWTVIAYGGGILVTALVWHNWPTLAELFRVSRRATTTIWTPPPVPTALAPHPRRSPVRRPEARMSSDRPPPRNAPDPAEPPPSRMKHEVDTPPPSADKPGPSDVMRPSPTENPPPNP